MDVELGRVPFPPGQQLYVVPIYRPVGADEADIDLRRKLDHWRFVRVLGTTRNLDGVDSVLVGGSRGSDDHPVPMC